MSGSDTITQDLKLSQLGFGCMRFALDPAAGEIDQNKVDAMFDLAIREGVNYFALMHFVFCRSCRTSRSFCPG